MTYESELQVHERLVEVANCVPTPIYLIQSHKHLRRRCTDPEQARVKMELKWRILVLAGINGAPVSMIRKDFFDFAILK